MNEVEAAASLAWWKSKKMAVTLAHHAVTSLMAVVGVLHYPSQAGAILAGYFVSASTVTVAHLTNQASVDRSQANSPNYPLPPTGYTGPAPPVAGATIETIAPAPGPPPGGHPGMPL